MEFEKLKKKNYPADRPIPEKRGRVRGNKNISKVGPMYVLHDINTAVKITLFMRKIVIFFLLLLKT